MATRLELRNRLRRLLGDTRGPVVWDDEALNDHLADAVREFGVRFPRRQVQPVAMVAGARAYAVEVEAVRVVGVEWPAGEFIPCDETVPAYTGAGDVAADGLAQGWRYDATARVVIVRHAPTGVGFLRLHWLAGRVPPATDGGTVPVDEVDLEVVLLMAAEAAWDGRQVADAKRGVRTAARSPFSARLRDATRARSRRMRAGLLTSGAG